MRINKVECDRCHKSEDFARNNEGVPRDWFEMFCEGVTWHLCLQCSQRALERPGFSDDLNRVVFGKDKLDIHSVEHTLTFIANDDGADIGAYQRMSKAALEKLRALKREET